MSVSLKNLPKMCKTFRSKDTFFINLLRRKQSIEKPKKYLSLKNLFYQQEKLKPSQQEINKGLQILNFISRSSNGKASARTSLTDRIPDKYDYNLTMINKYDESLNSSLSFISEFDLEEDANNINNSFDSSKYDNCEEEIEIKLSTKLKFDENEQENNIELEKEWNEIQESLLNKDCSKQ